MGLLAELKRRNVIRMAGLYLVGAWLLVQVAGTVLPMFGAPAWLPRSIVIVLALGFVPALVFAWVFELTPDGIKRDAQVDPAQSIAPQTARRMDRIIVAVLLLALVYFGFDKFVLAPQRDATLVANTTKAVKAHDSAAIDIAVNDRSIAVLPFADLSQTHDQEYFSDGMTEEILDALAKVPDLKVAGRTSSFYFKGKNEKLQTIGAALGVAHVLEGSVRKQGDKVRITAQLIQTKDGFHLWSESYDDELTDVFKLQEKIARAITDALQVALSGDQRKRLAANSTDNPAAHEQYLRGRYLNSQRGYNNLRSAEAAFKAALVLDPGFAGAWAGLAQTYVLLPNYSITDAANPAIVDTHQQALDAADHALRLDPTLSAALSARATERYTNRFDWSGAEADFRAAILANPSDATAHQWYGEMLVAQRRWAESDAQYERALALDPLSAVLQFSYGDSKSQAGSPDLALRHFDAALKLAPEFFEPNYFKALILIEQRRLTEAEAILGHLPAVHRVMLQSMIDALKDPSRKPDAIKQVMANGGDGVLMKPALLMRLGENELALVELEHQFAKHAPLREYLYSAPQFNPLRGNPRFQALLRQINLPPSPVGPGVVKS